jgi:hypothetical protein
MVGHGAKVHQKQEVAIAALLTCDSIASAAESVGLNHKTLVKWGLHKDSRNNGHSLSERCNGVVFGLCQL